MARSIFASFLFFVTLLVGVTSSNAQGIGPPASASVNCSVNVQLNVTGRIVCGFLGNPIPGFPNQPLVGVNAALSCDGGQSTIAQVASNNMGIIQFIVNVPDINLLNLAGCSVTVQLPVNSSCLFLPRSGTLRAPATFAGMTTIGSELIVDLSVRIFGEELLEL